MGNTYKTRCDVCGMKNDVKADHEKDSGSLRGFLCTNCMQALELFRYSIILLKNATEYLELPPIEIIEDEKPF